jgi:hypothetical protein
MLHIRTLTGVHPATYDQVGSLLWLRRLENSPMPEKRSRIGVYDRPKSADRKWLRWLLLLVAILALAFFGIRLIS